MMKKIKKKLKWLIWYIKWKCDDIRRKYYVNHYMKNVTNMTYQDKLDAYDMTQPYAFRRMRRKILFITIINDIDLLINRDQIQRSY